MSPGSENVVTCQGAFYKREQKTLPTALRPAAPLTLSRQQDESGYTKFNKWNDTAIIDLCSWLRSCPGCRRHLTIPSVLYVGLMLKLSRCTKTQSSSLKNRCCDMLERFILLFFLYWPSPCVPNNKGMKNRFYWLIIDIIVPYFGGHKTCSDY